MRRFDTSLARRVFVLFTHSSCVSFKNVISQIGCGLLKKLNVSKQKIKPNKSKKQTSRQNPPTPPPQKKIKQTTTKQTKNKKQARAREISYLRKYMGRKPKPWKRGHVGPPPPPLRILDVTRSGPCVRRVSGPGVSAAEALGRPS